MRINSIKIQNYRQYRSLNIEFNKKQDHDIHVLIGQNGMGKTNLLNAISWCLYDQEPHLSDKNKALPIINIETLAEIPIASTGKIVVTILASSEDVKYEFTREAICKKTANAEVILMPSMPIVTITKNYEEGTKIFQSEEANTRIEGLFPKKNSEYYFFDGERLSKYFSDNSGEKIRSSIFELSQVGLLQSIQDRLNIIIKEMTGMSSKGNKDLEFYKMQIEVIESTIEQQEYEINHFTVEAATAQQIINDCNEFLFGMPNIEELEQKRKALKDKEKSTLELCAFTHKNYLDFIREYSQLLNEYHSLAYSLSIIVEKEESGMLPPRIDIDLLKKSIKENSCIICGSKLNAESLIKINDILNKIQVSTDVSHVLIGMRDTLTNKILEAEKYNDKKTIAIQERLKARLDLDGIVNDIKSIDQELLKYENKEDIRNKAFERSTNENLLKYNLIELGKLKVRLSENNAELKNNKKKFSQAEKLDESIRQVRQERLFAIHAQKHVLKIKNEIMNEIKESLRTSTERTFLNLIWKKNTYDRVDIDENYNVALMHVDGYNNIGGCSAAEKAFLALSFTIALHKVACIDSPLVIDTPLSRVSDVNRINFAETLKELSKEKQMILFFTPSEYSEEVCSIFDPICSTKRYIETENERESFIKEY